MSFDWNLSDDDSAENDDNNFENWITTTKPKLSFSENNTETKTTNSTAVVVTPPPPQLVASVAKAGQNNETGQDDFSSSDNDDDDDDDDDEIDWEDAHDSDDDRKPPAIATTTNATITTTTSSTSNSNSLERLRPVNIDLSLKDEENENKKRKRIIQERKKKKKNKFRIESLPENFQYILLNLHQSHLLSIITSIVHISKQFSYNNNESNNNNDYIALAFSLVPEAFHNHNNNNNENINNSTVVVQPTIQQLQSFFDWYIDFVYGVSYRRRQQQQRNRAAGAPTRRRRSTRSRGNINYNNSNNNNKSAVLNQQQTTGTTATATNFLIPDNDIFSSYTEYLSCTNDTNPQLVDGSDFSNNNYEKNQLLKIYLFLAMTRSLHWRVRYVQAIEPISIDLDVNHPLLSSMFGCLYTFMEQQPTKIKNKNKKQKIEKIPSNDNGLEDITTEEQQQQQKSNIIMGWIEVLCKDSKGKHRWVHVDPIHKNMNEPDKVEYYLGENNKKRHVLAYALAVEHYDTTQQHNDDKIAITQNSGSCFKLTDVTPRYAYSWVATLKKRGIIGRNNNNIKNKKKSLEEQIRNSWWNHTIQTLNNQYHNTRNQQHLEKKNICSGKSKQDAIDLENSDDDDDGDKKLPATTTATNPIETIADQDEMEELKASANNEAIPTSVAAFQTHPMYVIPSVLGKAEVLTPDASKRVCGVFKGQLVYKRADVSTAYTAKKWLYNGRKVRDNESSKPIKRVKARKKPVSKNFKQLKSYGVGDSNDGSEERRKQDIIDATKPLDDDMEKLYGIWQTDPWSPSPVGPNDNIPVNEHKNVELELLNPGLVHIDQQGLAVVAKNLGIPYAPCLIGFEGHGGNRTPTIRGIVVHAHNEQIIREASVEVTNHTIQQEHDNRRHAILLRWKRLMVGLLTKDRLDREYG